MAPLSVAPEVEAKVKAKDISERYPVSDRVARRLWEEFRTTKLNDIPRDRLMSVRGVGEVTAEEINPKQSDALTALIENNPDIGLIPMYNDPNSEYDKWEKESPELAKEQITKAVARAGEVRRRL